MAGIIVVLLGVLALTWISRENPHIIALIKESVERYGLPGVFAATLLAGTLVPAGSPIVVAYASGFGLPLIPLTLVAATGYTLGTATSYTLAYFLGDKYISKRISPQTYQSLATEWNSRGYILSVLFSLIPGFPVDLLALVCGTLKTKPLPFFTLSWISLTIQFALCAWLGKLIIQWIL